MLGASIGLIGAGQKTVTVSDTSLFGGTASPGTASTSYTTVQHTNLVAPVSYAWSRVSGSTNIYVENAAVQSTRFFGYLSGGDISGVWKCTVTDAAGFSADTPNINITFADISL